MKPFDADNETDIQQVETRRQETAGSDVLPLTLADRGLPVWANTLAGVFALASALCVLGLALSLHVFQSVVVVQKDALAAGAIWLVAMVPVIGFVGLDYVQRKSLAGLQGVRQQAILNAQAVASVFLTVALGFVHPLLALPVLVAVGLAGMAAWLAARFGRVERLWDFDTGEAVSVLSGRDKAGFHLASKDAGEMSALSAATKLPAPFALVTSAGVSAWLVANDVLLFPAIAAVVCLSTWIAYTFGRWAHGFFGPNVALGATDAQVVKTDVPADAQMDAGPNAVIVHGLTATAVAGPRILSDITFSIAPGEFVGVVGGAGSGKTALLSAIADPFSMHGMVVQGGISVRDHPLWVRGTGDQAILTSHLDHTTQILPASGVQNLTAFHGKEFLDRARRSLLSIVYSDDVVRRIVNASDATKLPLSDQRALEFARMLFLGPQLYLLDRPESVATPALTKAFARRLAHEKSAGKSALIVTEDRQLLALCDRIIVMQDGRIIDNGPAREIQDRAQSGWQRFVCDRDLNSEDIVSGWMESQFRRQGDAKNRRRAVSMAAELLAFSCADKVVLDGEQLNFDFKHFEGYAVLRITDTGQLLSSGQMQKAQQAADDADSNHKTPLARIMQTAQSFEQALSNGKRVLSVTFKISDPRKAGHTPAAPKPADAHA